MRHLRILLFIIVLFCQPLPQLYAFNSGKNPPNQKQKFIWKNGEKALLGLYWLGSVIDAGQTIYGLQHGATELNPLLGKSPRKQRIYGLKISVGMLATMLCHRSNSREKKYMLAVMNVIQWSAVFWNGQFAGVGLQLKF